MPVALVGNGKAVNTLHQVGDRLRDRHLPTIRLADDDMYFAGQGSDFESELAVMFFGYESVCDQYVIREEKSLVALLARRQRPCLIVYLDDRRPLYLNEQALNLKGIVIGDNANEIADRVLACFNNLSLGNVMAAQ